MSVPRTLPAACLVAALMAALPARAEEPTARAPALRGPLGARRAPGGDAAGRARAAWRRSWHAGRTPAPRRCGRSRTCCAGARVTRPRGPSPCSRDSTIPRARRLWLDALDPELDPRVFRRGGRRGRLPARRCRRREGACSRPRGTAQSGDAARWALVLEALGATGCPGSRPAPDPAAARGGLAARRRPGPRTRPPGRACRPAEALVALLEPPARRRAGARLGGAGAPDAARRCRSNRGRGRRGSPRTPTRCGPPAHRAAPTRTRRPLRRPAPRARARTTTASRSTGRAAASCSAST